MIGRKPREVPDPCSADAQGEKHKRQDAARRGREGAQHAAGGHEPLSAPDTNFEAFFLDRHVSTMHPVATTEARRLKHAPNHSFASERI